MGCGNSKRRVASQATKQPPPSTEEVVNKPFLLFDSEVKSSNGDIIWKVSVLFLSSKGAAQRANLSWTDPASGKSTEVSLVQLDEIMGYIFWRGVIEVVKGNVSCAVTYSLNSKDYNFTVPAASDDVKILFSSCNGFSGSTVAYGKEIGGIANTWSNVLQNHRKSPFNVGIGGGDQLYCDEVLELPILQTWLGLDEKSEYKRMYTEEFTADMATEVLGFYMNNYLKSFCADVTYGTCLASIPMINQWDDHDIFDGYGSYGTELQNSPIIQGMFQVARRLYLLFQHHAADQASLEARGYFPFKNSISTVKKFGNVAVLALDTRSERTATQVVANDTYKDIFTSLEGIEYPCQHLLVLTAVPILNIDISAGVDVLKGMDTEAAKKELKKKKSQHGSREKPLKHKISQVLDEAKLKFRESLANSANLHNAFGNIDLIDDLLDGWDTENHDEERTLLLRSLGELSRKNKIRVTILSGDVHYASMARLQLPDGGGDMFNLVSSPIGNEVNKGASVFKTVGKSAAKGITMENGVKVPLEIMDWTDSKGEELEEGRNYLELVSRLQDGCLQARLHVEKDTSNSADFNLYEHIIPSVAH